MTKDTTICPLTKEICDIACAWYDTRARTCAMLLLQQTLEDVAVQLRIFVDLLEDRAWRQQHD